MNDNIVAIIPARSGSKRLPGKNVKLLDDRPLVAYSVLVAAATDTIDEIIIAADEHRILRAADHYGPVSCVELPEELTTDDSTLIGTLKYTMEEMNSNFDWVVLLQPTCPLRQPSLIERWIHEVLNKPHCDGGLTVDKTGFKLGYCDLQGYFTPDYIPMIAKTAGSRNWGRENGVFYMFKASNVLQGKPFGSRMIPLINPPEQSIANIDNQLDWDITEFLYHTKGYKEMFDKIDKELRA